MSSLSSKSSEFSTQSPRSPVIAIVAGEISGDTLGAGLVRHLRIQYPHARFIGIAGKHMQAEGVESLFDLEDLSVMGLVEVLKHLPRLLKIRRQLIKQLLDYQPDIYIGIDAPDFNLDVELKLKRKGIKTIHYVSPSIWAWRQNRIFKIAKATHLVLALLPFEKAFYDQFNVPCRLVGHTLADSIPVKPSRTEACHILNLPTDKQYLAILPGSRATEVDFLSDVFLQTALLVHQQFPDLQFIIPFVNKERKAQFLDIKKQIAPDLNMIFFEGKARQAMMVAQATLLASGTATLEAMLCKSPMVVGYKMKPSTYRIAQHLVKTPYISLPNLLANEMLIPEFIQEECTPMHLAQALYPYLSEEPNDIRTTQALIQRFTELHLQIQQNADFQAAQAVIQLIEEKI